MPDRKPSHMADLGLLVLANVMFGAQYPATKAAVSNMGPVLLSIMTFGLASLCLLPFLIAENRAHAKQLPILTVFRNGNAFPFIMATVVGLLPASIVLSWGVEHSLASNGSLLTLTIPVLTALLASMIREERMTSWRWVSFALGITGAAISSEIDWRGLNLLSGTYLFGNSLILVGCLGNAFNNVYSKGLLERFQPVRLLVVCYLFTALVCLPLLFWFEPVSWSALASYPIRTWVGLAVLGCLSWGVAMIIWFRALARLEATQVALSIYLLPFFGILLSAIFLREKLSASIIGGGLLVLVGTTLVLYADSQRAPQEAIPEP